MTDKKLGVLLLIIGFYSLLIGILNKKNLFSTSIPHSDKYYPHTLRRIVTIFTGIVLLIFGIKMILE